MNCLHIYDGPHTAVHISAKSCEFGGAYRSLCVILTHPLLHPLLLLSVAKLQGSSSILRPSACVTFRNQPSRKGWCCWWWWWSAVFSIFYELVQIILRPKQLWGNPPSITQWLLKHTESTGCMMAVCSHLDSHFSDGWLQKPASALRRWMKTNMLFKHEVIMHSKRSEYFLMCCFVVFNSDTAEQRHPNNFRWDYCKNSMWEKPRAPAEELRMNCKGSPPQTVLGTFINFSI